MPVLLLEKSSTSVKPRVLFRGFDDDGDDDLCVYERFIMPNIYPIFGKS